MSGVLLAASEIIGLPVVTLAGGEDVAEVRDVIYDPSRARLVGVTLNRRGLLKGRRNEVLPAEEIHAIGRHAVMIRDETALHAPDDAPYEAAYPDTGRDVVGNAVVTETGVSVGTIRDLILVAGGAGDIVGYQIGGRGFIPLQAQVALSGTTLVVKDATVELLRDDLVGLAAAIEESRSGSG